MTASSSKKLESSFGLTLFKVSCQQWKTQIIKKNDFGELKNDKYSNKNLVVGNLIEIIDAITGSYFAGEIELRLQRGEGIKQHGF